MVEFIVKFLSELDVNTVFNCVTSLCLFYLAFRKDTGFKKQETEIERIEKLYAPFYRNCLIYELHNIIPYSKQDKKILHDIIAELNNNVQYMGIKSQALYPSLYKATIELLSVKDGTSDFNEYETVKEADRAFFCFAQAMIKEYRTISKNTKLPKPLLIFEKPGLLYPYIR